MRAVISFSTTTAEQRLARRRAKKRGFDSVSEYLRFLLRKDDEALISEEEILRIGSRSEKYEKEGKLLSGKSLADFVE